MLPKWAQQPGEVGIMSEDACGLFLAISGLVLIQAVVLWLVLSAGLMKGPKGDG